MVKLRRWTRRSLSRRLFRSCRRRRLAVSRRERRSGWFEMFGMAARGVWWGAWWGCMDMGGIYCILSLLSIEKYCSGPGDGEAQMNGFVYDSQSGIARHSLERYDLRKYLRKCGLCNSSRR